MGMAKYIKNEKDEVQEVILQSGIPIKPLYTPKDLEEIGFSHEKDLALPGEYRNLKPIQNPNFQNSKLLHSLDYLNFKHWYLFRISCFEFRISPIS